MKPFLLMFVASALIAQVPTQAPVTVSDEIHFYKEVSDSYQNAFRDYPLAEAYFRGRADAFAISGALVDSIGNHAARDSSNGRISSQ